MLQEKANNCTQKPKYNQTTLYRPISSREQLLYTYYSQTPCTSSSHQYNKFNLLTSISVKTSFYTITRFLSFSLVFPGY